MLRPWRRAAVATLAGAAAIAAQMTVIAPAQAAAATITINATAKLPPVTNDVLVFYKASGGYASAKIHGKITGAKAGEVAALYALQFPFKTAAVRLASVTLKSSAPVYSFTVTPTLATKYAIKLFASGTSKTPLASSAAVAVYVTDGGTATGITKCSRPVCHEVVHSFTIMPSSAVSTEIGKHVYLYFGLNLSTTGEPPPPSWLYLNAGNPTQTKSHRVNAGEIETTFTFTFTIGNDGYYWLWSGCMKDTESKDGLGLPGHHGCGTLNRVPTNRFVYLG